MKELNAVEHFIQNSQTIMGRFHPQIQKEDTTCAYGLTFNRSLWANGALHILYT